MLHYAVVFFIIAIIAAVLGFGGIAAGAAGIAKVLFFVFLILALITFLRREVARTEHRAVTVPVVDEAVDECTRVVKTARRVPRRVESCREGNNLVARLFRKREHGRLDVGEVLVERRG